MNFSFAGVAASIVVFAILGTAAIPSGSPVAGIRDLTFSQRMAILVEIANRESRFSGIPIYMAADSDGVALCRSSACSVAGTADRLTGTAGKPYVLPVPKAGYIESAPMIAAFLPEGGVEGWAPVRFGEVSFDIDPETGLRRMETEQ